MPNHKNRYMATASLKYDFAKWINLTGRVKMDRNNETHERMYDAGTNTLFASKYGYYSKSNVEGQQIYGELLLNINKYFANNTLNLTANIGTNFETNKYQSDYLVVNLNLLPICLPLEMLIQQKRIWPISMDTTSRRMQYLEALS